MWQRPYGMARLAAITTPGITDRYLADKIYGFSRACYVDGIGSEM